MAHVALYKVDAAEFWYRSNCAVRPAIRATFGYSPSIQSRLQRRYPGAMFEGSTKSWLLPNASIEDVTEFFAEHDFMILIGGKPVALPKEKSNGAR